LPSCTLFDKDDICHAVDLQPREHLHTPQVMQRLKQQNVPSKEKVHTTLTVRAHRPKLFYNITRNDPNTDAEVEDLDQLRTIHAFEKTIKSQDIVDGLNYEGLNTTGSKEVLKVCYSTRTFVHCLLPPTTVVCTLLATSHHRTRVCL
jgi:hypothetical protein